MRRLEFIVLRCVACILALTLLGAKAPPKAAPKPAPVPASPWTLTWSDEFDGTAVDARKWNVADPKVINYDGGINSYDLSNVSVQGGSLVIQSQCLNLGKGQFSSGRVTTKGKYSFLYGKIEVRAQLPGTQGMWPAIWMLPQDGTWPPEIDIMELIGNDPRKVYMTQHWGTRQTDLHSQTAYAGPDFTQGYHTFSVEWAPGKLTWLIDGSVLKVVTKDVPSKAMYLIMNTSVGGDWPGLPDASTAFPAAMRIDYVRVYKATKGR